MNPKNYLVFFIIISIFILPGCKKQNDDKPAFKNRSEINIRSKNNLYVCADQHKADQVIANRSTAGDWEKFTIEVLDEYKIRLLASNFSYIGSDQENGGLSSRYPNADFNTVFKITRTGPDGFVLQDYRNNYVSVGTNQLLMADKETADSAAVFTIKAIPVKPFSYFSFDQLIPLIAGLLLILISLITFQYRDNKGISVLLLVLGGFCVRLFTSLLIPYLNLWDEQYHALVAKNMMSHPFTPMLFRNQVCHPDDFLWTWAHIWLHKQPLFLWQMALSMKIFGVNELAMRLPSLVMSSVVIFFIYRIGKLTVNSRTGFFGALLFSLSNFSMEIAAGFIHTDHNDVAFLFYICASFWAWVEYENSSSPAKKYFLILTGLFTGSAVLVKWLTGLLLYFGWGLSVLFSKERRMRWVHYRNILISLVIAVAVFLPWQIYILTAFPELSRHEYAYSSRHFFEVIEKHGGDFWWHFNIAKEIYGIGIYPIILFLIVLFTSIRNRVYTIAFFSCLLFVYLFFAIAATKMVAFTYCISFLIFLAGGAFLEWFFKIVILNPEYLRKKIYQVIFTTIIISIPLIIGLDIEKFQEKHTMWKQDESSFFYKQINHTLAIKKLPESSGPLENYVIFNCQPLEHISMMFYNDVIAAYDFAPDIVTYESIRKEGYKIAVFDDGQLPPHIANDQYVRMLQKYW